MRIAPTSPPTVVLVHVAAWLLLGLGIGLIVLWGALGRSSQAPETHLSGFFPTESNESFSYRFSQPRSAILITMPHNGRAELILQVSSQPPLSSRDLTLRDESDRPFTVTLGATPRVLHLLVATDDRSPGTLMRMEIQPEMVEGDSRPLGAMFEQIAVKPLMGPAQSLPWLLLFGGLMAAVGAGALLRGVSWRLGQKPVALPLGVSAIGWPVLLGLFSCGYAAVISYYTILNHQTYGTTTYDMGQYDQTLWLISRGLPAYSTGMGVHLLGNHAALILYPLAALYWIVPDVRALLIFQSLVVVAGTIPIYLLAKDHGSRAAGAIAGIAYLLHPATQNMALFEFHPDTIAATALLFVIWATERRRWWIVLLGCLVVMASKENFALTVAWFGLWLVLRREWRWGVLLIVISLAWFFPVTRIIQPFYNGTGASLHLSRFQQYGNSFSEIIQTMLLNPGLILTDLVQLDRLVYLLLLLSPFAFLPLLRPRYLFIVLPALGLNLLSNAPYQRELSYHYSALIVACLAMALVESLIWLTNRDWRMLRWQALSRRVILGIAALLIAIGMGITYTQTYMSIARYPINITSRSLRAPLYDYVLMQIPDDASVSAQQMLQPHLTHRVRAYMFPNPFEWTVFYNPGASPFPHEAEYIVYDTRRADNSYVEAWKKLQLLSDLQASGQYQKILDIDGVYLLRKNTTTP